MRGARLEKWEMVLAEALSNVDEFLEEKYGKMYPLRRNRPERGKTANNKYDGLFSFGAKYSLGIGSEFGPGYGIELRISTFSHVPKNIRQEILEDGIRCLREELKRHFPQRNLQLKKDGKSYKIFGDLSL